MRKQRGDVWGMTDGGSGVDSRDGEGRGGQGGRVIGRR